MLEYQVKLELNNRGDCIHVFRTAQIHSVAGGFTVSVLRGEVGTAGESLDLGSFLSYGPAYRKLKRYQEVSEGEEFEVVQEFTRESLAAARAPHAASGAKEIVAVVISCAGGQYQLGLRNEAGGYTQFATVPGALPVLSAVRVLWDGNVAQFKELLDDDYDDAQISLLADAGC